MSSQIEIDILTLTLIEMFDTTKTKQIVCNEFITKFIQLGYQKRKEVRLAQLEKQTVAYLREQIITLQEQLNQQQNEINSVKQIALDGNDYARNHKHYVNGNRETHMILHT